MFLINAKLLLILVVFGVTTTAATGHAAGKGKGGGSGKGGSALIGYDVLTSNCDVEFSSTKSLSNIVIEYAEGSPIKFDNLSGYNYTILGALLEEATAVYVKSGKNGKRNLGEPMDSQFFDDIDRCFTPFVDWGTCPCVGTFPWDGVQPFFDKQTTSFSGSFDTFQNLQISVETSGFERTINNLYDENGNYRNRLGASSLTGGSTAVSCTRTVEQAFYLELTAEDAVEAVKDCRNGLYELSGQEVPQYLDGT